LFLTRVQSRNFQYLYLRKYKRRENYADHKKTLYRFGRIENALKDMYRWQEDINSLPDELKDIGCNRDKVETWIKTLETGIHPKTSRVFKPLK